MRTSAGQRPERTVRNDEQQLDPMRSGDVSDVCMPGSRSTGWSGTDKNPEKCKGGVPDGAFHCLNKPGQWVECNGSGDYMCCAPNTQGGKDCEQIESFQTPKNPKANLGAVQGGQFQVAPTNPPPRTTPVPKAGMSPAVKRRGVEGDQPDGGMADPSGTSPETK